MATRTVLITGATGKQGGATISALIALPDLPFQKVLALTRNPDSSATQALVAKSPNKISIIRGDLDNSDAIFDSAGGRGAVWGVFSVQQAMGGGASWKSEERQGKALIDSAVKYGVSHFVYTSVDRSGNRSDENPTNVPHFISKHRIEQHLKERASESNMSWTILRPVAFFEDMTPDFAGRLFATAWKSNLPPDKPLQLVATEDIGYFAAQALVHPESWHNRALSIAGDELTFSEANEIFKSVTGNRAGIATTNWIIVWAIETLVKELRTMFTFFAKEGYGADIEELRKMHPQLQDFKKWLQTSVFVK
ncbi:hypothetical protein POJ06DRAFT_257065 [Lipomyces tetrasporus]|uniref:NmrA-like domain-containing protein n=1 Tax=Lipomyces tetrasporus TaxID=54092 RepID=A0AAD7QQK9_9ASCO|nr:uncharacterized protein POJ06DRAFT_257065 [Lipomyces tetrasporus]KAJ8099483.1 hypothetical protein POJ06DRAFT_257065 [Lipomyces tetrasporus]